MRPVAISLWLLLAALAAGGCCLTTGQEGGHEGSTGSTGSSGPSGGASGQTGTTGSSGGSGTAGGSSGSGGAICVQPSNVDFGNVQVLGTPAAQTISFCDCGSGPVTLTFPGIAGPQATDFGASGPGEATLQPGHCETITVSYSPAAIGASNADLPYSACSGCTVQTVNLTGVGVDGQLTFSPSPVNFGMPPTGSTTTVQVTGTNTGTESLTVTSLGLFSGGGDGFTLAAPSQPLPITLAPLASFTVDVSYSPTGSGSGSGSGSNDELVASFTVADSGVARRSVTDPLTTDVANGCSLTISPASVSFGNVSPNTMTVRQVTLQDVGDAPCSVSAIALGATSDPDFSLGAFQATARMVLPGSSAMIAVTFTASSLGAPLVRMGQLTFQTGDPTNPSASVPLMAYLEGESCYCGGWPKWHLDSFNSGQSTADTSGDLGTVFWKDFLGTPAVGQTYLNAPVISTASQILPAPPSGEVIYQLGLTGVLYSIDADGPVLATVQLGSPAADPQPSTPLILNDGSIVVATGAGGGPANLYYLNSMGAVTFSEPFGLAGFASYPTVTYDGSVLLADGQGAQGSSACGSAPGVDPYSAVAFNASLGSVAELAGLPLPFTATSGQIGVAVASDDTSYWGSHGQFFAVSSPAAGFAPLPAWPGCGVTLTSAVNAVSNLALDTLTTNNLYAYSAWETGSPDAGYTVQGNLAALDPASGAERWIFDLPATSLPAGWTPLPSDVGNASPAISAADGTVYVGNGNGLYAVDGATGAQKWLFASANVSSSPAVGGDGTIFFGCDDGHFYGVTAAGQLRFEVATGGPISSSPAIGPDGTVVFVSDDGYLYAVR